MLGFVGAAVLIVAIVIGLVARGLMRSRVQTQPGDERFFAKLVEVQGEVKRQAAGSFSFEAIDVGDSVQVGDSLVTDAGSGAVLELATGERIRVNEGVLLHLEFTAEKDVLGVSRIPDLEVIQGSVEAIPAPHAPGAPSSSTQASAPAPRIRTGNEVVEIRQEKVVIRSAAEKEKEQAQGKTSPSPTPSAPVSLPAISTPAPATPTPAASAQPGASASNKPNAVSSVRPQKSSEAALPKAIDDSPPSQIELVSPAAGQSLSTGVTVFKWKTTPVRKRTEFVLERAELAQGPKVRIKTQLVDSDFKGEATQSILLDRPGYYTFGLRSADDSVLKGLNARVDFEVESPTEKIKASAKIEVGVTPPTRTIVLSWRAPPRVHLCGLEVWDQANTALAPRIQKPVADQGVLSIDVGTWRTPRAFFRLNCSTPGKKDITLGPLGVALYPRAPEVKLTRAPTGQVTLEWRPVPFADHYEIEEFTTQSKAMVNETQFQPHATPGGRWRVRSWYGIQSGLWSEPTAP